VGYIRNFNLIAFFRKMYIRDAWVAQSVGHWTLDFSSGHDLRVVGLNPESGSVLGRESA